jgi:biopolymer transport protein ExbD
MAVLLNDLQDGNLTEVSDINITPFIDVIVVLLIIFMVALDGRPSGLERSAAAQARQAGLSEGKSDLTLALGNDIIGRRLAGYRLVSIPRPRS